MTLAHGLNLPASRLNVATADSREWAKELYETIKADAPPSRVQVSNLATPAPPLPSATSRWWGMRAERNTAGTASRRTRARLPEAVVRALVVYLLSLPVFCFAAMDMVLFFSQGRSALGPALDAILMVFGGGLVIISLVATALGNKEHNRAVSR